MDLRELYVLQYIVVRNVAHASNVTIVGDLLELKATSKQMRMGVDTG
jgi:hypothetical protein